VSYARRLFVLCLALGFVACAGRTKPAGLPPKYDILTAPGAVDQALTELQEGQTELAFERLHLASDVRGLPAETRNQIEANLDLAAEAWIKELDAEGDRHALKYLYDLDLRRPIAVQSGVLSAQHYLSAGYRLKAYQLIKKIDEKYPFHHMRDEAGTVVAEAGFSFAADNSRYGLFYLFKHKNQAPELLEYLTLNHVAHELSDDAFYKLAQIYEENKRWQLAIERQGDLVLYSPGSPFVPASKARIPHLRLAGLSSPEYDRRELLRARDELDSWLSQYAGHEAEAQVRLDLLDCMRRLADNDLSIARFYRRVKNAYGAEYHARRAIEEAQDGHDDNQQTEARELLESILTEGEEAGG
jgi:hypothetical protein